VVRSIVSGQLTADLLGSISIFKWWDVGLGFPIILHQSGEGFPGEGEPASGGVGDLRLHMKFRLFRTRSEVFSLALAPYVTFPTGKAVDQFEGAASVTAVPMLAASFEVGRFGTALDLGYRVVKGEENRDVDFDDELLLRAGASFQILREKLTAIAELDMATVAKDAFQKAAETPLELILGLRYAPKEWLLLNLGGGAGLTSGYATPDFRLFGGAVVTFPKRGKPGADGDGDGIPDSSDGCPNDAEDLDSFEDADGCPDADNDGDGVLDADDKCPSEAETANGFEDDDGCPDGAPDPDGDGILGGADKCPTAAEDIDGFEDADGCPDADNDGDGVLDADDKCPAAQETKNGFEDDDGCPDSQARIEGNEIEISDKVYFKYGSAEIDSQSFALLDEIAAILAGHPEIELLSVEGHTDSRGKPVYNQILSEQRAAAVVKYLEGKGIAGARLRSKGFGASKPIVPDAKTDEEFDKNRRVEFIIAERAEAPSR